MRRFKPGSRLLSVSVSLLMLPVFTTIAYAKQAQTVAKLVSTDFLQQNLLSHQTVYLRQMLDSPAKREEYIKSLYANQMLEQALVDNGLDQGQHLLETLRNSRSRALLDTLIGFEFGKINEDLELLAKERYDANPEIHRVRKKIKIALIYIEKSKGMEGQARAEIEDIVAQLNAEPGSDKLFYKLAKEHSDDKMASQGGVNKKWLIAPVELEKSLPILQASYALDTPGQMTEIVESAQGFSVVRLLKVTPEYQLDFSEAKDRLIERIISQLQYRKKAEVMQALQAPDDLQIDDETVEAMISETFSVREKEAKITEN